MQSTDVQYVLNIPHITIKLQMEYFHLLLSTEKIGEEKKSLDVCLYEIKKKKKEKFTFLCLIQPSMSSSIYTGMVKLILTNFEPV